jgi:hypothetical protein
MTPPTMGPMGVEECDEVFEEDEDDFEPVDVGSASDPVTVTMPTKFDD